MAQRRKQALPKKRSRSPRQAVETLRRALDRERAVRKHALAREKEALEQQAATADILRVISSSPTSVQPVFEAIVARATDICEAQFGALFLVSGEIWRMVSHRGASAEAQEVYRSFRAGPTTGLGRMTRERKPVHIEDLLADAATAQRDPLRMATIEKLGARTFLAVPLLKESAMIGGVVIYRKEVRAFGESQIRLLATFADQAVIAMENVRLFNETKEALEQQKASAEILGTISRSMANVEPVFDKILDSCERLFAGHQMGINLVGEDGHLHLRAFRGPNRDVFETFYPIPLTGDSGTARAIRARAVVHFSDVCEGMDVPPVVQRTAAAAEIRSVIFAPMIWEDRGVGAIFVGRAVSGDFSEKAIRLLETFADQAVIAIQNARLFNETKVALERQTATGEILASISSSLADTKPVFEAIVRILRRLLHTQYAIVRVLRGANLELAAYDGEPGFEEIAKTPNQPLDADSVSGRAALSQRIVQFAPIRDHPDAVANAANC